MFEELMGAYGGRLVIAVVGVGIGLLVLIGVLWLIRSRSGPSPFVRGGKNRQPRLQVLDAAAVDARRRLVLIRRDGVEHLIMIGGPTDIVIESGISTAAPAMPATAANRFQPMDMTVPVQAASAMEARPAAVAEPRPAPIPRPAAPEPRVEPARESVVPPRETPRAAPPVAPTTGPISMSGTLAPRPAPPVPANNAAAPEPAAAPRIEPPARQAPEVKSEQLRPIAALAAAAAPPPVPAPVPAQVPAFDDAADVLDAARGRVFQEAPEPRAVPVSAAIVPPALQSAADKPKQFGSDFERILEEEMANNLAARETAVIPQPNRQMQPRNPGVPPVTGATPEPSLQSEVARIFGEMSVTRDK
ncbi:flagellar biosynthetic protein FliO [Neorhizobium vignae]|uniref:flagellar biosynthetic protein FliO n=1 Tax=Neorhizobium vignae TaxID=690585 RepID=UPI00055F167B|nr:flagellar biosynthetic protein FliO [Neorhizobium vignae]